MALVTSFDTSGSSKSRETLNDLELMVADDHLHIFTKLQTFKVFKTLDSDWQVN